jgi:hypothetical protein
MREAGFVGWVTQYVRSDGSKPTFISEGLVGKTDATPNKILISSSGTQLSMLWIAQFGELEVKKLLQLETDKLYFTTSVVVKNIGATPISDFYCKRPPDQSTPSVVYPLLTLDMTVTL